MFKCWLTESMLRTRDYDQHSLSMLVKNDTYISKHNIIMISSIIWQISALTCLSQRWPTQVCTPGTMPQRGIWTIQNHLEFGNQLWTKLTLDCSLMDRIFLLTACFLTFSCWKLIEIHYFPQLGRSLKKFEVSKKQKMWFFNFKMASPYYLCGGKKYHRGKCVFWGGHLNFKKILITLLGPYQPWYTG